MRSPFFMIKTSILSRAVRGTARSRIKLRIRRWSVAVANVLWIIAIAEVTVRRMPLDSCDGPVSQNTHHHTTTLHLSFCRLVVTDLRALSHGAGSQHSGEWNVALPVSLCSA